MDFIHKLLVIVVLVLALVANTKETLRWIANSVGDIEKWTIKKCIDKKIPFTQKQRRVCKSHLKYMPYISSGAKGAQAACSETFVVEKWNCQSIKKAPYFKSDIADPTKESAVANAISAAFLVHNMVSDCARSRTDCPKCQERVEKVSGLKGKGEELVEEIVHKSGACNDMFVEPLRFAQLFTQPSFKKMNRLLHKSPEKKARQDIEYHNKKVGFKIAYKTRSPRCYCHGATRTCYTKICYTAMDFFYQAEQKLKKLYYNAKRVEITKKGNIIPYGNPNGKISDNELIYSDDRFDVCKTENGNRDRQCNIEGPHYVNNGRKLCKDLCCGGKYERRPVRLRSECYCKFRWCCEVKCKICTKMDFRYFCTA